MLKIKNMLEIKKSYYLKVKMEGDLGVVESVNMSGFKAIDPKSISQAIEPAMEEFNRDTLIRTNDPKFKKITTTFEHPITGKERSETTTTVYPHVSIGEVDGVDAEIQVVKWSKDTMQLQLYIAEKKPFEKKDARAPRQTEEHAPANDMAPM